MLNKISVLYNKPEDISDVSDTDTRETAMELAQVLARTGYETETIGVDTESLDNIASISGDLVFNLIEWTGKNTPFGLKAIKLMENMGLPYTGSDVRGYKLSCDKQLMKREMKTAGIPTPQWKIIRKISDADKDIIFPAIVKPLYEHCGAGITQQSVVCNEKELKKQTAMLLQEFRQPVLAEEYIKGRELHVTILEKNSRPWVLPPAEVTFKNQPGFLPILTFEGKWHEDSSDYAMSGMEMAVLGKTLETKIRSLGTECYKKLGGRDYPRLDIRIRNNRPYVLEINNNPGVDFHILSGMGVSAHAAGFTYHTLLDHIIKNAYLRFQQKKLYGTIAG